MECVILFQIVLIFVLVDLVANVEKSTTRFDEGRSGKLSVNGL
jgi:hypothetical protein